MKNSEIKFRVFGSEYMSNPFTLFDVQEGKIQFASTAAVMQYTGLKDKNDKEIYDFDILKVGVKHGFNSELLEEFKKLNNLTSINGIGLHFTGIVRIDLFRGLMFESPENGYREPMFSRHIKILRNHSEIEVIGNVYENPELLK